MSAKSVNEFFAKVEGSKPLQAKLKAMHQKTTKETKGKLAADVVKLASAAGFKFTAKELAQARAAKAKKLPAGALGDVTGQEMCSWMHYCTQSYYCVESWT